MQLKSDKIKSLIPYFRATNVRKYVNLSKHLEIISDLQYSLEILQAKIWQAEAFGGPLGGTKYDKSYLKRLYRKLNFQYFRYKDIRGFVEGDLGSLRLAMYESGIKLDSPASEIASFFDNCEQLYFVHKIDKKKNIK